MGSARFVLQGCAQKAARITSLSRAFARLNQELRMPELPEVETVRRTLEPARDGVIRAVWHSGKPLRLGQQVPISNLRKLIGGRIAKLRRLGKYLLVEIVVNREPTGAAQTCKTLLVHLGMSGRFRLHSSGEPSAPHTHVVFTLDGGRELRFSDPRRFGQIDVYDGADLRGHPALASLGPDPLVEPTQCTGDHLFALSRGRAITCKAFILDQRVIAGVGNIYASEALWRAGVSPHTGAGSLTRRQAAALSEAITAVLEHALTNGGTTLRDFVAADGSDGEHFDYLHVYGKAETPCARCKELIVRCVDQGRATYFCRRCQKA